MALLPMVANAQINITKKFDRPEKLATITPEWYWIYDLNGKTCLVLKSDNQFDNNFWLSLGETRQECMDSVKALISLLESMDKSSFYEIKDATDYPLTVSMTKIMGVKYLIITDPGTKYAGGTQIHMSALKQTLGWVAAHVK